MPLLTNIGTDPLKNQRKLALGTSTNIYYPTLRAQALGGGVLNGVNNLGFNRLGSLNTLDPFVNMYNYPRQQIAPSSQQQVSVNDFNQRFNRPRQPLPPQRYNPQTDINSAYTDINSPYYTPYLAEQEKRNRRRMALQQNNLAQGSNAGQLVNQVMPKISTGRVF